MLSPSQIFVKKMSTLLQHICYCPILLQLVLGRFQLVLGGLCPRIFGTVRASSKNDSLDLPRTEIVIWRPHVLEDELKKGHKRHLTLGSI